MRHPFLLAAMTLAVGVAPVAAMDASQVHEHTLANGMPVLLWPDPTIPNLALYTFWKVGSRNEAPGITGVAHFFEHMMFNGAERYGPGEFDRTMEAAGGANNAYTSKDLTVYQDWVPASALDLTLDLERDRIGFLAVDPTMVESERGVVQSERQRSLEDSDVGLMWEQLVAAAYTAHPYQWPILGWKSDIAAWRQEDLESFFHSYYSPQNGVVVVCGAFETPEMIDALEAALGTLPTRELPRGVVTDEPEQRGERRVELRKEASLGALAAAYHIPSSRHEDVRALELLGLILGGGESSRIHRRLVEEESLALWVDIDVWESFDPGLFEIWAQAREGVSGPSLEAVLAEELQRVVDEPVSDAELAKAKRMLLTSFYRSMATISGRAEVLGHYLLYRGDWRKAFDVDAIYAGITADEVREVAARYLHPSNRTVVTLIPEGGGEEVSDAG